MKRAWASVFCAFVFLATPVAVPAGEGAAGDTNASPDPTELVRTISDEVGKWARHSQLQKPAEDAKKEQLEMSAILSRLAGQESTLAKQLEATLGGGRALAPSPLTEALLNANREQFNATFLELVRALNQPASLEGLASRLAAGLGCFEADCSSYAVGADGLARIRAESDYLLGLSDRLKEAAT
jgi:hypothetical protein